MKSSFISHLVAAIIISVIILLIYASVQQSFRASANDPQLQIARDISHAISAGKSINNLLPRDTIDLAQSLAVFTEIFDDNGNPLQSTGLINGNLPKPPAGIFSYTNQNKEDVLTWQPQNNVRMAMVFEKTTSNKGFVAAGRSLKEVELRENNLTKMVLIAWVACMILLLVHLLFDRIYLKRLP